MPRSTPGVRPDPRDAPTTRTTRRALLAGAATVAAGSLAGCQAVLDALAGAVFEDVNVVNSAEHRVSGSIEIDGPDGSSVLSESFDLAASQEGTDGSTPADEDVPMAIYEDVWEQTGDHDVRVDLDEGSAVGNVSSAEETVEVTDTEETMLLVTLGSEEGAGAIAFLSGESASELE